MGGTVGRRGWRGGEAGLRLLPRAREQHAKLLVRVGSRTRRLSPWELRPGPATSAARARVSARGPLLACVGARLWPTHTRSIASLDLNGSKDPPPAAGQSCRRESSGGREGGRGRARVDEAGGRRGAEREPRRCMRSPKRPTPRSEKTAKLKVMKTATCSIGRAVACRGGGARWAYGARGAGGGRGR